MDIQVVKDLMTQFDESSLREFSFKTNEAEICFSKNEQKQLVTTALTPSPQERVSAPEQEILETEVEVRREELPVAEGQLVQSPLVGVAYLSPAPGKPNFVSVGDQVKKGQTLLIIEAMKVMNEVPAPNDGIVTEVLVSNEEMIEYGKGLVRIK
nr:acetyl-CoA carboxylase biotin carboxyl carrier protein subunit [Streptococcus catagoni]